METSILGAPSFSYIEVVLEPGEKIIAESDAMSTMAADLDMTARLNGGFFSGLGKKFFGGESLFINEFENRTSDPKHMTLVQGSPGDMREIQLNGQTLCLQPGAFVACTPEVKLGMQWAGFVSGISREGFFKLMLSGHGTLWFGAYGGILEKELDGDVIVDTAHLVAYEPQIRLKLQLAGGIFSSFFSGEGLVTRLEGKGRYWIQTRSISGLAGWLNSKL